MAKGKDAKKAKDTKKEVKKVDKPGKFHPIKYFKEVINEVKKVTWPERKELMSYTAAVFAFIVSFALLYGLADLGLSKLLTLVVSG